MKVYFLEGAVLTFVLCGFLFLCDLVKLKTFSKSASSFNMEAVFPSLYLSSKEPPGNMSWECIWYFLCPGISDCQGAKEVFSYF